MQFGLHPPHPEPSAQRIHPEDSPNVSTSVVTGTGAALRTPTALDAVEELLAETKLRLADVSSELYQLSERLAGHGDDRPVSEDAYEPPTGGFLGSMHGRATSALTQANEILRKVHNLQSLL